MDGSKEIDKVIRAAEDIANMKCPSVERLLRKHGYGYEADKIMTLVSAVNELPKKNEYKHRPYGSD